jgi:hypothetical protein
MALLDGYDPQDFAARAGLLGRLLSLRPDLAPDQQGEDQPASTPQSLALAPSLWPTAVPSPNSTGSTQPAQYAQAHPGFLSIDPLRVGPIDPPVTGDRTPSPGPLIVGGGALLGLGLGALILNNAKKTEPSGDEEESGDKPASTPVGRRGDELNVIPGTNQPVTIGGRNYTGHAADQMQARGVPPSAVEGAIQNGEARPGNKPGRTLHIGVDGVKVVTDPDGQVITVIPGKNR